MEKQAANPNPLLGGIIKALNGNPIFRMSLGSKELFHSNFLEYLFQIDKDLFVAMMNDFLPQGNQLPKGINYQLGRELEDFDICLYHESQIKEKNKTKTMTVHDLVIENKVKSIPYKEQLTGYEKKATRGCRLILLTLSGDFPDKNDRDIQNWIPIGYNALRVGIEKHFINSGLLDTKTAYYLTDYCLFIEQLDNLKNFLVPTFNQGLFYPNDLKSLEQIRLHDLYIKLRCSWFAMTLKNLLEQNGIKTKVVHSYKECEDGFVNINVDMNQGNGQVAAWICDGPQRKGKKMAIMAANTFEVVVQGDQYRHGINQQNIKTTMVTLKEDRLNALYNRLGKISDKRPFDFLHFNQDPSILPDPDPNKRRKFKDSSVMKDGPFDCYSDGYVYRYRLVGSETIDNLLKSMISDITCIYQNIPNLY